MSVGCLVFPQQDCFLVNQEAKPGAHKGILQTHFKKHIKQQFEEHVKKEFKEHFKNTSKTLQGLLQVAL